MSESFSFEIMLEDGSKVRCEKTEKLPSGLRLRFDKDGLAYKQGRTALRHARSPEHDLEKPVGSSYTEPERPDGHPVTVWADADQHMALYDERLRVVDRRPDGLRVFISIDGKRTFLERPARDGVYEEVES